MDIKIGLIIFFVIVCIVGYLVTKALDAKGYEYENNPYFGDYE